VSYYRLQSSLPTASHALDDASERNRAALLADANSLIATNTQRIDEICAMLTTRAAGGS
jgi:hypothetical protein